jgi:hypothetical protein
MAGVKVTDLPALGTAASDDIMYIVDTSTNTSKQIEVQDIYSGMPQFESGEFTVVPSGENDCIVNPIRGLYSRVNNIVTCTINTEVIIENGVDVCSFNIAPPVASNFAVAKDCAGIVSINTDDLSRLVYFAIQADFTFNQITIEIKSTTIDDTFQNVVINLQYIII